MELMHKSEYFLILDYRSSCISNTIILKDYFLPNKYSPSKLLINNMKCKHGEKNVGKMCLVSNIKDQQEFHMGKTLSDVVWQCPFKMCLSPCKTREPGDTYIVNCGRRVLSIRVWIHGVNRRKSIWVFFLKGWRGQNVTQAEFYECPFSLWIAAVVLSGPGDAKKKTN